MRMGLDIYVGSFTRYYRGDWETVVARVAREQGISFQVIRTNPDPPDKGTDPVVIGKAGEGWRSSFTRYYRGDWETVVARVAREQGISFQVIRTNPDPPDKRSEERRVGKECRSRWS